MNDPTNCGHGCNGEHHCAEKACDAASIAVMERAYADNIETCFSRAEAQKNQCSYGKDGICCRLCHMGPCRLTRKAPTGICGANADTIVARNYLREVAGGTAAHSDHGRHLVLLLASVARGEASGYAIRDEAALRRAARTYGIDEEGRSKEAVAADLATCFLAEFTEQEKPLRTLALAPPDRQGVWRRKDIEPAGIDRMVVECLHRSTMGVDHDPEHVIMHAFRTALADGWGGSRVASIVSDILFGTPSPVRSAANLGVLEEKRVNVLVHGHEPALSEMLAVAANDPEVVAACEKVGATGINLAGICCTANEVLMRHGIPVAGNFLQQELAIITGAVEAMIIDVQCCMPSLPAVAAHYHTDVIATSDIAQTEGADHSPLDHHDAYGSAKKLLLRAAANYSKRDPGKVSIPDAKKPLVAGFSVEAIRYMLGGRFRASFRPLNDAIIARRIVGVVAIVGCNNPKYKMDDYVNTLTRTLIANNVLVLKTGCAAIASGKAGLLTPEAALGECGQGLREVCEAVGIPPVLHMGSCVDNARILEAASEVVREGGLGNDLSDIPAVGVAPEWMSEKAVAIGSYVVASGIDVVLGHPFHIAGSERVSNFLNGGVAEHFGASFHVHSEALEAYDKIMALLEARREKLGINRSQERKLLDMKDRRQLETTAS